MRLVPLLALPAWVVGCGGSPSAPPPDAAAAFDGAGALADLAVLTTSDASDGGAACPRVVGEADRARKVVVSHPFTDAGKGTAFEVLDLSPAGALARSGVTFEMGTANDRPIRFTPDGAVGLVAQDDGSLGVFRSDGNGALTVVHAGFKQGFYAQDVVVAPDGARAFVLDLDTAPNGGGLYEVAIGCDGTLAAGGHIVPGDSAAAMAFLDGAPARAVLAVKGAPGAPMGADTDLVDLANGAALVAGGAAFPDGMAIPSSVAPTPDGRFALITDNGLLAGSRVAVVALPAMKAVQLLMTPNPAQAVVSPFGDAALVLNSDGKDALRVLRYDAANAGAPFSIVGEVAYQNGRPQLPSAAAVIARGALKGRVLVAENLALRQLQFGAGGDVKDVGLVSFGAGSTDIVGTVGVQP
jgi:hypothetical protein